MQEADAFQESADVPRFGDVTWEIGVVIATCLGIAFAAEALIAGATIGGP